MRVTAQQPQQGTHIHVVIVIHVAEPPGVGGQGRQGAYHAGGTARARAPPGNAPWALPEAGTHFLPDSIKRSYSTAILQHSAWRLWAAEQLVLTTWPADKGRGCEWVRGSSERAAWPGVTQQARGKQSKRGCWGVCGLQVEVSSEPLDSCPYMEKH